jgi:hypothetical protein
MGGRGLWPITRASLLGIPLPLCSCSVIPVAVELRRQGAGRGPTAAFMVSTPETGVDSIMTSIAMLHPLLVVFRPVAAMLTAVLTGLAVERFSPADLGPEHRPTIGCCDHHAAEQVEGESLGLLGGMRYAFVDLLGEILPYLIPALLITAALGSFVEPAALADVNLAPWVQRLIILAAGIPVYVCATAATPVAAAMIVAGLSPGAGLVFLLAGPATNLVTISAVSQTLGRRSALVYVLVVSGMSYLSGTVLDILWADPNLAATPAAQVHQHDLSWLQIAASLVLGTLIVGHALGWLRSKLTPRSPMS